MSEWIEYTGIDEQLAMLLTMHDKFIVDSKSSILNKPTCLKLAENQTNIDWLKKHFSRNKVTRFLICKPHPYTDLIKIWTDTGCPVYIKIPTNLLTSSFHDYWDKTKNYNCISESYPLAIVTNTPDWNIPDAEYSLTLFEDQ